MFEVTDLVGYVWVRLLLWGVGTWWIWVWAWIRKEKSTE